MTVLLHIGERETRLSLPGEAPFVLAIGTLRPGAMPWRQDPPSAPALESAIADVEDQVMPLLRRLPAGADLHSADREAHALLAWAGLGNGEGAQTLPIDDVERAFNELAAISLGRPAASSSLPVGGAFTAYVLILRECMHHLGFRTLTVAGPV
ncbi:hypothetical protein [Hydrogenophaga sp.]|uniref:hypothetical protein n=1 Tax=Hydrogenophaga sp. TaxID=1904254 RepID=UPI0026371568|nr:hypothetical protein [Hydrogenophaga sp.]MCW5652940.1 hypothetical protein [Hydrogenophaga sp.]